MEDCQCERGSDPGSRRPDLEAWRRMLGECCPVAISSCICILVQFLCTLVVYIPSTLHPSRQEARKVLDIRLSDILTGYRASVRFPRRTLTLEM
jgi:hypothetical protein